MNYYNEYFQESPVTIQNTGFSPPRFSRRRLNGKVIATLLTLLILSGGLIAGFIVTKKSQEIRKKASGNSVKVSFIAQPTVPGNNDIPVSILADLTSFTYSVNAISMKIQYPSDKLRAVSVDSIKGPNPASLFYHNFNGQTTTALEQFDLTVPGVITINAGSPCTDAAPQECYSPSKDTLTNGIGIITTIHFAPISDTGVATISFGPDQNPVTITALDTTANPPTPVCQDSSCATLINTVDTDSIANTASINLGGSTISPTVTQPSECGNGIPNPGEQCDDGNTTDGDGCSSSCMIETTPSPSESPSITPAPDCGNNLINIDEECDDGNNIDGDGCSKFCLLEQTNANPCQNKSDGISCTTTSCPPSVCPLGSGAGICENHFCKMQNLPPGCSYESVQCIQAPCDPVIVCLTPTISPSPSLTPSPSPNYTIVNNFATEKTCNQICADQGMQCEQIGISNGASNYIYRKLSANGAYCENRNFYPSLTGCSILMQDSGHTDEAYSDGRHCSWAYCQCVTGLTPLSNPVANKANLYLKLKFQGIIAKRPNKTIQVVIKRPWSLPIPITNLPGTGDMQDSDSVLLGKGTKLFQTFWRGNLLYARSVPVDTNGNPTWNSAGAWDTPTWSLGLPGSGPMQSISNTVIRNGTTLLQGIWRGNSGYTRIIPLDTDGNPTWSSAGAWSNPIPITNLPGSGDMQAGDNFVVASGKSLFQSFWRGNKGYYRITPIDTSGNPVWSSAGAWSNPIDISTLPGSGDFQSLSGEIIQNGKTLLQGIWRGNVGYSRLVPLDANGMPLWNSAGNQIYSNSDITITSNTNGIYTAQLGNLDQGNFDIYVKGWAHVWKKFANQNLSAPDTTLDLSRDPVLAGDINPSRNSDGTINHYGDNIINGLDLTKLIEHYDPDNQVTQALSEYDINLDGFINGLDLTKAIENYQAVGDQP